MKPIAETEIDTALIGQMVMFLLSSGTQGYMPEWYRVFVLAHKLNASVWDVEKALSENGENLTPKREWASRALTLSFAEAEVEQQRQAQRRPNLVRPAFGGN